MLVEYLALFGVTTFIFFTIWDNYVINFAPGPFRLPVLGSAFQLYWSTRKRPPFVAFKHFGAKYGPLVYFRLGQQEIMLINDFETAKSVMNNDVWFDRPQHALLRERTFGEPLGLATGNGDGYREMRRFTVRTLREAGKFTNIHNTLDEQVAFLVARLDAVATQQKPVLQVKHLFTMPVLNVVWSLVSASRTPEENKILEQVAYMIDHVAKNITIAGSVIYIWPWIRHVAPGMSGFAFFQKIATEWLQHYVVWRFLNHDDKIRKKTERQDWIDSFISQVKKHDELDSGTNHYTGKQFASTIGDLLFAGSDTTNHTLEFAIDFITRHPRVQRKVQQEIDEVLGNTRSPNVGDRHIMPYTEATLTEIQRLANVLPITARCPTEDTIINGYRAGKGTYGVINLYSINTNKSWGDPFVFRPERFLSENQSPRQLIPEKVNKVMAFGAGKRGCLGDHLAREILFVFFVTLLQHFRFERVTKTLSEEDSVLQADQNEQEARLFSEDGLRVGFTLGPHPFEVKVYKRNSRKIE